MVMAYIDMAMGAGYREGRQYDITEQVRCDEEVGVRLLEHCSIPEGAMTTQAITT